MNTIELVFEIKPEKEKKFRPVRHLNQWSMRYRRSALPTELTSQLGTGQKVGSSSSFFAIIRPRLGKQNPAKYIDRSALDRDLMILQWALRCSVPLQETDDWRLLNVIEEYKHRIVDPLRVLWTETTDGV